VRNATLVQFLTYLNVSFDSNNDSEIILIEAKGYSLLATIGIPKLSPVKDVDELTENGLLELDFNIEASDSTGRERLDWDLKVVYELAKFPENICGIKVNAAENADICLFTNTN
jgi:hypothetical protein